MSASSYGLLTDETTVSAFDVPNTQGDDGQSDGIPDLPMNGGGGYFKLRQLGRIRTVRRRASSGGMGSANPTRRMRLWQECEREDGTCPVSAPEQVCGKAFHCADEQERRHERDVRGYAEPFERTCTVGGEAHDGRNAAAGEQVADGEKARQSEPARTDSQHDCRSSRGCRRGHVLVNSSGAGWP